MLLVTSSQYYSVMALICVIHLYGVDYLPILSTNDIIGAKLQNKIKFGIKCLQKYDKEWKYS